ncbi:hypothetical protein G6N76_24195 [Rhizobium daejeonense]|uniref:Uncharacterized protein n=1 Tax=Rhizobium daejeonense TaxID=240521 RepID=A0A6M1S6E8_9HYPH|nr:MULTISPECIES: hypothetical protein [Rhizobiaceae]NGO66759.1 hypothetical protein [Rhizobium daejeonense]QRI66775.1 hypothetical protein JQ506_26900 [Shinella sp. PSBB067]
MSRYTISLHKGERTDDEAVIGFDPPLRTYFLQGFESDDDFGTPEIWLGTLLEGFPTLEGIVEEARANGYEISNLDHADMIAMLREAGHEYEPSIAERLGFVR